MKSFRKLLLFTSVLFAHLVIIVLLVLWRDAAPLPKKQGNLSVFSLSTAPSQPSIRVAPVIVQDIKPISTTPEEAFGEQQQSAEGDPEGEVCSPIDVVTMRLTSDPTVPAEIKMVPRTDRSISEAIVIWNAEWSNTTISDDAPLRNVRDRIETTLAELPLECLETPVAGPRLIPITIDGSTTFLAFGSGQWTWQQLIEPQHEPLFVVGDWTWEDGFKQNFLRQLKSFERSRPSTD
ncbi:hypothetical protein [Sphingorhabdus sp.]|uniref:hypothetical protein n=1 Tax=Sphingorhabdus sp. TaxID=1902408 RepID=UPI00398394DB